MSGDNAGVKKICQVDITMDRTEQWPRALLCNGLAKRSRAVVRFFGLVLLEALASGLPIAGFPVDSTRDVVAGAPVAVLDDDLRSACLQSLALSRSECRSYAKTMTWDESARCFLGNLKSSGALLARREQSLVSA